MRFVRRRRWDEERARELQAYLDHEVDDNIARGMTPIEARRAAHVKLGNVTRIREDIYEMNTIGILESVWQDFRYGARLLRRNPTFAIVAVVTLALGTGANTAIFQLVDAVRLRTLPVANPHELVEIQVDSGDRGRTGSFTGRRPMLTNPLWELIRDRQQTFSSVMAWGYTGFDLADGGEIRPAEGIWVSGSFFGGLGVRPAHGRLIGPADDVRGCAASGAVLSHAFWQREYSGDPRAVGRTIVLSGHRFDIIGISAAGFFGVDVGRSFDVAVPLCSERVFRGAQSALDRRDGWFLAAMGRLRPGQRATNANTGLIAISAPLFRETLPPRYLPADADSYLKFQLTSVPASTGISGLRRNYSSPLWVLLGVTCLVLLIACANLANLMLARATTREREITIRLAMGASRRRIVRQMLSESLLLAVVGAAAGLLIARWLSAFLVASLSTGRSPLFLNLAFDWRIFGFTAMVAGGACLLFGLAPALRSTASPATSVLGVRGGTDSRERFTLRRALVIVQVSLSVVLLIGAILLGRSLRNLVTLDPGFRPDGVVVVELDLRRANVAVDQRRPVFDTIIERVKNVPGVDAVAQAFIAPMSGSGWNDRIMIDGQPQEGIVNFNGVGAGYFQTLGTRLVSGREFSAADGPTTPRVAIVNELFARRYFAGRTPLGREFYVQEAPGDKPAPRYRIVGVVADSKYRNLREELAPIAYVAAAQEPAEDPDLQLVLHTSIGANRVTPAITQALREVNPAISISFLTMEGMLRDTLTSERLMAGLSAFFGGLAVIIATVGLYGVMSYMVARRRMEIGIRMALGADSRRVVRMIVGDAGRLLAIGLSVGAFLSILAARSARALLYGVEPWDPLTVVAGCAALGLVALLASWWPAYRASRLSPTVALRET
jgi:predicted permease